MKKLKAILLAFMSIIFVAALAQAQNGKYKSQVVSSTGVLTDENNTKIGTIESDGSFKDMSGNVIGKFIKNTGDPSRFDFSDKSGKKIATILADGTVKDLNGNVLYTVSAPDTNGYCKVYDSTGKEIGIVHEDHKHKGACMMHSSKKK